MITKPSDSEKWYSVENILWMKNFDIKKLYCITLPYETKLTYTLNKYIDLKKA